MNNKYSIFLFLLLLTIFNNCDFFVVAKRSSSKETINAFLIPHSHCDVGWIQTYEQYYTENVTHIITNVVNALLKDPSKRFNWAEIIYFERWWNEQTDFTQSQVRQLVENKQLEFVGGGWAQNDEAITHYQAVLNQMTIGHQFLLGTFGVVPEVGWQIDPFGPSTLTAMLFRLMGFKYHIINRVDDRLKHVYNTTPDIVGSGSMINDRSFEFMWYPSPSYGESLSLFTHVLDNHYNSPQTCYPNATNPNITICTGFDFEGGSEGNPPINATNVAERAEILVQIIKERVVYYRHNNMLLPFGNDFRFQDSNLEFDNMDQLIEYINANASLGVNIRYATLSEYFESVAAVTEPSDYPTIKGEDYYTYTQCLAVDYQNFNTCVNYWSGYFSSYPLLKQTIRNSDTILRHIETLFTLASATPNNFFSFNHDLIFRALSLHRNVSGILTHHDAVTGTAKEYVRNDYFNMLYNAQNTSLDLIPTMISYLLSNQSMETGFNYQDELLKGMNIGQVVVVSLSNSIAWDRVEYVHFPVGIQNYAVYDFNQRPITSQIIERIDKGEWELYFEASVPALGISTYFIMCIGNTHEDQYHYIPNDDDLSYPIPSFISKATKIQQDEEDNNDIVIGNSQFELHFQFNQENNNLLQLAYYQDLIGDSGKVELNQYLAEYNSMTDDCYKFRTHGYAHPLDATSAQFYLTEGPIASMVTVVYTNNVTQIFTVYNSTSQSNASGAQEDQYFEIENVVSAGFDKEIVMRFNSSIQNGPVFYTNNGLEMLERTWTEKYNDSFVWSLVSGNFYPAINTGMITDGKSELVVLNKQSMAASSQANGLLEFLLIRRSNYTQWSIHETMNDTSTPSIKSRVLVGQPYTKELQRTPHTILHENELLKMFAPVKGNSIKYWCEQMKTQFTPMNGQQFPQNLHLLSFNRQWNDNSQVLMRLINIYEIGQNQIYSQPITVSFSELFTQFNVTSVVETTLTANVINNSSIPLPLSITLNPIEIKTFGITFNEIEQQSPKNDDDINQIVIN